MINVGFQRILNMNLISTLHAIIELISKKQLFLFNMELNNFKKLKQFKI